MKLKLAENSLYAILLRSSWWTSVFAAVCVFGLVRLFLPWGYAAFATSPFVVIVGISAWRKLRTPGGARLEASLERLRAMSWEEFAAALEAGWRREGWAVKRVEGAADFELEKAGRVMLVCARRWKASVAGVEPLKDLAAAATKRQAGECAYVCCRDMTANARTFARDKKINVVEGAELLGLAK